MPLYAILGLFALVFAIAFLVARSRGSVADRPEPAPPEPTDADLAIVEYLKRKGWDLSEAHDLDFYFDFATESAANEVARILEGDGFATTVERGSDGSAKVQAEKMMTIDVDRLRELRRDFDAKAKGHGGKYDGWGTSQRS